MDDVPRAPLPALLMRLARLRRRTTAAGVAVGAVGALAAATALWALAAALEAVFWMPTPARLAALAVVVGAALGLLAWWGGRALLRHRGVLKGLDDEALARRVGQHFQGVDDRLVNLLQLARGQASAAPSPLVGHAIARLESDLAPLPIENVEAFEAPRRLLRWAWMAPALLAIFWLAAPSTFTRASARLVEPTRAFARPAPFGLDVAPGSVRLVRGDTLALTVEVSGRVRPARLAVETRRVGETATDETALFPDSAGVYRHAVVGVRQPIEYRVVALPVESPWYRVEVVERPVVSGVQVTVTPPAYTGLARQRLPAGVGDVTALPGSRVDVEATVDGADVVEVALDFGVGRVPLALDDGSRARGAFRVQGAGQYRVVARSQNGLDSRDPIAYTITPLRDEPPTVALTAPQTDFELDDSLRVPLSFQITDDFGFSRLALVYRIAERRFGAPSDTFSTRRLPLENPRQLDQAGAFSWRLRPAGLDLLPGDVVEYRLQVWDNDAVAGFKTAQTALYRLVFQSLAEQYDALDETQDGAEDDLQDLVRQSDAAKENFERLRDELRQQQEGDWEDTRQLESLKAQQEGLSEQLENLTETMQDVAEKMRDQHLVTPETLEQYRKLQQVMEEIDAPELREALDKLREALENLDLENMERSFEQFEFNEQQYRERLERALELFKNLRIQQELEEAARRAESLAEQQQQLQEETRAQQEQSARQTPSEKQDAAQQLAAEQQRSADEMRQLEKQIRETEQRMQESPSAPRDEMEQLSQQMDEQQLSEQMDENSEQLEKGETGPRQQQQQQQMQQQLRQMQQQLRQMKGQMQQQQAQANVQALRRALDDVLRLSEQQESLRLSTQGSSPDSPALRDAARRQTALSESFQTVSDSIQAIARRLPNVSRVVQRLTAEARREMTRATSELGERRPPQAAGHQKAAMTGLNELALRLSDMLQQAMSGQPGSGSGGQPSLQQMLEQLGQMTGQQQQLNGQIQQMLNDMQGDRLSTDGQQRMRQLAEQQAALRRQLRQMSRNPETRGQLLGDLEDIARQMEESIEEMQRGGSRPLVERQQQILTRLLEAQRSMQQRGEDERREKRDARPYQPSEPGAAPPSEAAEQLRRDLIRALESGYAPDYQNLIKRYFELLQQQAPR